MLCIFSIIRSISYHDMMLVTVFMDISRGKFDESEDWRRLRIHSSYTNETDRAITRRQRREREKLPIVRFRLNRSILIVVAVDAVRCDDVTSRDYDVSHWQPWPTDH